MDAPLGFLRWVVYQADMVTICAVSRAILYPVAPLCKLRANVLGLCLLSLLKGLRQTKQNSAHKRRIILCHRVHGLQPSLARRPHGNLSLAGTCTERLRHLGAGLGCAARDVVKN